MAINKAPENKSITPKEETMPADQQGKREKICDIAGHMFPPSIKALLENPGLDMPDFALCSRCAKKINLKDVV